MCALKRRPDVFSVYEDVDGDNEYVATLTPNQETQFNVIAVLDQKQVVVPYKPITLKVPQRPAYGGRLLVGVLVIVVVVFGMMALYFFFRGKKL